MNLFKISLKNIKKSWKDYSIYFMTLIIAVSIFYMFNSLANQDYVKNLSETGKEILKLMGNIIQGLSVAVAIVLGLLMVYANNFLIKRRKKEFGVYRMLGMGKRAVSKIILGETIVVGLVSLVIGIVIGIFFSQFISVIVIRMFDADVSEYAFTFSKTAVIMTLISFVVIFVVVSIFNTLTVSKYQLIDLLSAEKKGEKKMMKNKALSVLFVVAAVMILGISYYEVGFRTLEHKPNEVAVYILMGVIATFLFFIGISGFLLELLQKNKNMYYRGVNSFVVRQFCSNINTSAVSMAIICLMLFMTLGAFSMGFSIKNTLNEEIREETPVDITLINTKGSVAELYEELGYPVTEWNQEYLEIPLYENPQLTFSTILGSDAKEAKENYQYVLWETRETIIKLSDYNKVAKLYGWDEIELQPGQYASICNFEQFRDLKNKAFEKKEPLVIGGVSYENAEGKCIEKFLLMANFRSALGIVVLPDEAIDGRNVLAVDGVSESGQDFIAAGTFFAGNYNSKDKKETMAIDEKAKSILGDYKDSHYIDGKYQDPMVEIMSKGEMLETNSGLSVFVIFTILYMGLVFVVSSAAILALKVLSDSIDSVKKYEILKKLGTDKNMMKASLLKHVLLCFAAPMVLAIVHTIFGLKFAGTLLNGMGMENLFSGVISTFVCMVLIYGGYMMLTYFGALRVTNIE